MADLSCRGGLYVVAVGYISIQIAKHATGWLQDVAETIVLEKLGEALLIAGILGFVVDEALKRELVRDAIAVFLGISASNGNEAGIGLAL